MKEIYNLTLLSEVTTTGSGNSFELHSIYRTFQAVGSSESLTWAATVKVQVSNDGTNFLTLATIDIDQDTTTDGFSSSTAWKYVRGNVTAISGTATTVSLVMGDMYS